MSGKSRSTPIDAWTAFQNHPCPLPAQVRIFGIWDADLLVGGVIFVEFNAVVGTCELGCWLEPAAEARGPVTPACRALRDWAFTERGIHRVEWRCRGDIDRSAKVARRLGMTLEGTAREAWKVGDTSHNKQVWSVLEAGVGIGRGLWSTSDRHWTSAGGTG